MEKEETIIDAVNADTNIEALQSQLEEAETKNKELGDKIYKLKKENKAKTEIPAEGLSRDELENFYQEKKFFESRPNMVEYKDKINEFTSKGLTFEQAEKLVVDANPDIVARQNTQKANFTTGTPDFGKSTYTMEELKNLPQHEYNKVIELKAKGEVIIN